MKFTEIISRITGFSIPVFGVSWNPPVAEATIAKELINFLEDRRVLFNDYELELPERCAMSVLKIRDYLTDTLKLSTNESKLAEHIRPMRSACRSFLDTVQGKRKNRLIINNGFSGGPES